MAQDSQSIEDRGGIPQNVKCGPQIDRALELVVKRDWSFAYPPISEEAGDNQQLKIECEPLDGQERHSFN